MQYLDLERGETLSTGAFYDELAGIDFSQEGPRLRAYSVDMDPDLLVGCLSVSRVLTPIASRDGFVSHVRDNSAVNASDNSASSRFFSLHTDGKYLPKVPEIVVLHCVDPGTCEIPTVFVDTEEIIEALERYEKLDDAKAYNLIFTNKDGLRFERPLLETNPRNGDPVLNIAIASPQCQLRPRAGSNKTQSDADTFYELIGGIVNTEIAFDSHIWQDNDTIVFDNLRLIHGRGSQEHKNLNISDIQRHLLRIWMSRND